VWAVIFGVEYGQAFNTLDEARDFADWLENHGYVPTKLVRTSDRWDWGRASCGEGPAPVCRHCQKAVAPSSMEQHERDCQAVVATTVGQSEPNHVPGTH